MKCAGYLIFVLVASTLLTTTTSSIRNRKEKDRKKERTKMQKDANLCTMETNAISLYCVCIGGSPPLNTTSAECMIFSEISRDDDVWSLFATQPHILQLKFLIPRHDFAFIPTEAISSLSHLESLQISHGNIRDIQPYAFANSTTLNNLTLSKNNIVNLDYNAFAHLVNLTEINLEDNEIAEIRRDVFVNLPKLIKLLVARNNLSVIQEGAFRHLAHLLELELNDNCLSVLTRDTFTGLSELKRLDLSFNDISMLGDLTFSELWILEELNLDHNQIELISNRAFAGLTHLKKLILSHNQLIILPDGLLRNIPTIGYLDLRHNKLETITYNSLQPIIRNFINETSFIYLSDNKFACDCRLLWMHKLYNETKNQFVRRTLAEAECHSKSPKELSSNITPSPSSITTSSFLMHYDGSDDETIIGATKRHKTKDPALKRFFTIPINKLPCPQQEQPTEASWIHLRTPGYAEINVNSHGSRIGYEYVVIFPIIFYTFVI